MSRKVLESCLPCWNMAANRKTDKPRKFGQWIVAPRRAPTVSRATQGPAGWRPPLTEAWGPHFPPGPGHLGDAAHSREPMTFGRWSGRPFCGALVLQSKLITVTGPERDTLTGVVAQRPAVSPPPQVSRLRGGGDSPSTEEPASLGSSGHQSTALYRSSGCQCGRGPRVWSRPGARDGHMTATPDCRTSS